MIYRLVLLLIILLGSGSAQTWQVVGMDKITSSDDGLYFYPQFSPDGDRLYFTTSKYKGLFFYDLSTRRQETLTETEGAGYLPVFSVNGKKIFFRKSSFVNRRRQSVLVELDLETKTERRLDTGNGQVMNPQMADDHLLVFQNKPDLQAVNLNSGTVKKSVTNEYLTE